MDLGPAQRAARRQPRRAPEATWVEPMPDARVAPERRSGRGRRGAGIDPARVRRRAAEPAAAQRAVLILLRGPAVAGHGGRRAARHERRVGQQRAPARPGHAREQRRQHGRPAAPSDDEADAELLAAYVDAFERYDVDELTSLLHEDATQSMPPYDLWLAGRDDIFSWWVGPGSGCRGSKVDPDRAANGAPAFGQYKPNHARRRLSAVGVAGARGGRREDRRASRSSSTRSGSSRSSACRSSTQARSTLSRAMNSTSSSN